MDPIWLAHIFQMGGEKPPTRFRCLKNTSDVVGPKGAKESRGFGVLIIIAREVNDFESRPTQEI